VWPPRRKPTEKKDSDGSGSEGAAAVMEVVDGEVLVLHVAQRAPYGVVVLHRRKQRMGGGDPAEPDCAVYNSKGN